MSNIKSFKLFVNFPESFINDIKDISLEFEDIGFEVFFSHTEYVKSGEFIEAFATDIEHKHSGLKLRDIEDTILRINDLSNQYGFKVDIEKPNGDCLDINKLMSTYSDIRFRTLSIIIYKL